MYLVYLLCFLTHSSRCIQFIVEFCNSEQIIRGLFADNFFLILLFAPIKITLYVREAFLTASFTQIRHHIPNPLNNRGPGVILRFRY